MRYFISFLLVLLLAAPTMAAKGAGEGGEEGPASWFEGPVRGAQAETVEKAMKLAQDSRVVLTGHIVASVAGEKNQYIFKDASGEMTVIITPKQLKGKLAPDARITPEVQVRLSGKIDKTANAPENVRLRVGQLEVVK